MNDDVKVALKSMGVSLWGMLKCGLVIISALALGLITMVTVAYVFVHFTAQAFTVLGILILSIWFWLEVQSARIDREYQEELEKKRNVVL